jgi:hypothetical protein
LTIVYLVGWYVDLAIWAMDEIDEQLENLQRATAGVGRSARLLPERTRTRRSSRGPSLTHSSPWVCRMGMRYV